MGMEETVKKLEEEGNKNELEKIRDTAEGGLDGATQGLAEQAIARLNAITKKSETVETIPQSQITRIESLGGDKNELEKRLAEAGKFDVKVATAEERKEIAETIARLRAEKGGVEASETPTESKNVDPEALKIANEELSKIPEMRPYDTASEKSVIERYYKQGNDSGFSEEEKLTLDKYLDDTNKVIKAEQEWFNGASYVIVKKLGNPENAIDQAEQKLIQALSRILENKDKKKIQYEVINLLIGGAEHFSPEVLKLLVKAYEEIADEPIMGKAHIYDSKTFDQRHNFEEYVNKAKKVIESQKAEAQNK